MSSLNIYWAPEKDKALSSLGVVTKFLLDMEVAAQMRPYALFPNYKWAGFPLLVAKWITGTLKFLHRSSIIGSGEGPGAAGRIGIHSPAFWVLQRNSVLPRAVCVKGGFPGSALGKVSSPPFSVLIPAGVSLALRSSRSNWFSPQRAPASQISLLPFST